MYKKLSRKKENSFWAFGKTHMVYSYKVVEITSKNEIKEWASL
jgi:hypothetical protein